MTGDDPAASTSGPERDPTTAPGGASCRVRRSYGPSYALAPASGTGGGSLAGRRARALGDQPGSRHQGAPLQGEPADPFTEPEPPTLSTPPFPDRKPRRRPRNPSERTHKTTTRLSESEKAEIAAAAKRRAVTVARFLAAAGLAAARGSNTLHSNDQLDAAIDELVALRTALSRVGNNINQIAHTYNAGGEPRTGQLNHSLVALARTLSRIDDAADTLVQKRL